jgi:hypothetical protein
MKKLISMTEYDVTLETIEDLIKYNLELTDNKPN